MAVRLTVARRRELLRIAKRFVDIEGNPKEQPALIAGFTIEILYIRVAISRLAHLLQVAMTNVWELRIEHQPDSVALGQHRGLAKQLLDAMNKVAVYVNAMRKEIPFFHWIGEQFQRSWNQQRRVSKILSRFTPAKYNGDQDIEVLLKKRVLPQAERIPEMISRLIEALLKALDYRINHMQKLID